MARYFLEVAYNGTAFHGSQLQGTTPTVQLYINQALTTLLREDIISFGASRTDEGVHALCNFYHFDTTQALHQNFQYKMNAILPGTIAVKQLYSGADTVNARFDAISRRYRYRIYHKKDPFLLHRALFYPFTIDTSLLKQTAVLLPLYSNFESFSKRNTQSKTFLCKLTRSEWEEHGNELHYVVEGNRFLRGMVRGLVGTQLQVARGRISLGEFKELIEGRDCTRADFSVTGNGLYLEDISYPQGSLIRC